MQLSVVRKPWMQEISRLPKLLKHARYTHICARWMQVEHARMVSIEIDNFQHWCFKCPFQSSIIAHQKRICWLPKLFYPDFGGICGCQSSSGVSFAFKRGIQCWCGNGWQCWQASRTRANQEVLIHDYVCKSKLWTT